MSSEVLIVCIGNELVADDAVGYVVYEQLVSKNLPDTIRIEFCGVGGVALLDLITGNEDLMIVVDAMMLGAVPGTVHQIDWQNLPQNSRSAISAHGIGLKETLSTFVTPTRFANSRIDAGV